MIKDNLKKETLSLHERGIHDGSYFHVVFSDGSESKEHDTNWSDISEETAINHYGTMKLVMLSKHPIKNISVHCGTLNTSIDVEKGDSVYQAIKSKLILDQYGKASTKIVGRVVGIVRNGFTIEERFLSTDQGQVFGYRT